MGKSPRYHQRFPVVAQADLGLVLEAALDRGDVVHVHDGRAMDLPEARGVELVEELADGLADEALALGRHHARVLLVRAKEEDFLDGYEAHVRADGRLDP